jgi:hypothetical protein
MRKIMLVTPLVATAALVFLTAGPALAADGDATFQITPGEIAISPPGAAVALGSSQPASVAGLTFQNDLGGVTVTDLRSDGSTSWHASVSSTDFTAPNIGGTLAVTPVPATDITYTTPAVGTGGTVITGTVDVVPVSSLSLSNSLQHVQDATGVSGGNTAAWTPHISVAVPAGAWASTYTAALTHSLL